MPEEYDEGGGVHKWNLDGTSVTDHELRVVLNYSEIKLRTGAIWVRPRTMPKIMHCLVPR
jgi:hypothetical protein